MNVKTKSTVLIIGSLILGILIGVFGTINFLKPPGGNRVDFRERNSYKNKIFDIIQPTETQKDTLTILIQKYEDKMRKHHKMAMAEYRIKADSMKQELARHLNPDQMEKLEKYHQERKERYKRRQDKRKSRER